jgi:hypothetical protein
MTIGQRLVVQAVLLIPLGMHSAFAQENSTWFLAEGASNATFTEEIQIGNPSAQRLEVTVTLLPQADAAVLTLFRRFPLMAHARLTVRPGSDFGLDGAASAVVSAVVEGTTVPADIVVERTMTFAGAAQAGSHNASAVPGSRMATTWILAEGANGAQTPGEVALGFDTFVLVANPNPTPAEVRATYLTAAGASLTSTQVAPPYGRVTFWPRAEHAALGNAEFSTIIDSLTAANRVVAERAMYFDDFRSGHDALGVTSPSGTWFFAEGFTGGSATTAFETFLLLVNPGTTATIATVDYLLDTGAVISRTYPLAPRERFTVWVDQEGRTVDSRLTAAAFGMRVTAPVPIVAERAMYWGTPSAADITTPTVPWREGHATAGIPTPAAGWAFAEGQQGAFGPSSARFDTFFQLANPQVNPIAVQATFVREDGMGLVRTVCVAGNARADIWTDIYPELQGHRFATFLETVTSSDPACPGIAGTSFVAERALYSGPGFEAGHVNIGTPWTGTIATPPPANVCSYAISPGTQDAPAEGLFTYANIAAACAGTIASDVPWITPFLEVPSGFGGFVAYAVHSNTSTTQTTAPRTGTITLRGAASPVRLTVTQSGAPPVECAYSFSSVQKAIDDSGGFGTVSLTTDCAWSVVSSNSTWLTVTSPATGTGDATVTFAVARNESTTERTGRLTVSGIGGSQALTITQAASPIPPCSYTVRPGSQIVPATGGTGQFVVSANRAGCAYVAAASEGWIALSGEVAGEHSGTVGFSVAANSGGQRPGLVTISWNGGSNIFAVMQESAAPSAVPQFSLAHVNAVDGNGLPLPPISYPDGAEIRLPGRRDALVEMDASASAPAANISSYQWSWSFDNGVSWTDATGVRAQIRATCDQPIAAALPLTVRLSLLLADGTIAALEKRYSFAIESCGS